VNRVFTWCVTAVTFGLFYLREVLHSNLRVARDVLARDPRLSPGIVSLALGDLTDRQTLALATLLTMTPGTLSLEVDEHNRLLHIHTLYTKPSPDELRASIQRDYERPIRILF
jgi:multicomponent Na+:H+ antiporter subunit E